MSDTSGRMSGRQFASYDPASHSWRMCPDIGLWGSIEFSETWPRTGFMRGGAAFELPASGHHTTGSGSSSSRLFPTPKAYDGIMGRPRTSGRPIEKSTHLGTVVTLLPTPLASDAKKVNNATDSKRKTPSITQVGLYFPNAIGENMSKQSEDGSS